MNNPTHSAPCHQNTWLTILPRGFILHANVGLMVQLIIGVVLAFLIMSKAQANSNHRHDIAAQQAAQVSQSGPHRYQGDNRRYDKRYYNDGGTRHYDRYYRPYYRPFYRPYYPWGLGWGVGLSTGWNNWGGAGWNTDWGWGTSRYWNSPYSGIGLSIPMGNSEPVALSLPVHVTTSMQYSHSAGAMVSSMPANTRVMNTGSRNGQNDSKNNGQNNAGHHQLSASQVSESQRGTQTASSDANTKPSRALRSLSHLPSNARVVQQDGRTLYEWQGSFYAFDWNSQTYQEQ